ncbi:hypothetical protein ACFOW1_01760 [Parasediminibacterium paludis]|uniref:Uncharacterized protein n=1 Tax=Parasediminibacterium paludis TaxID=908966 RepID=A0ABV8PRU7_9BACT
MNIKKIARPLNKAKNTFIQWLKENKATDIDVFEGEKSDEWDYYRTISAFIGENLYTVYFTMWQGKIKIDYSDEENRYSNMSIDEFLQLLY